MQTLALPDDIVIRALAHERELEFCARLMSASTPWTTFGLTEAALIPRLKLPGKETYLAWRADAPVGFIMLDLRGPFAGYIQIIGVLPEWRRQGIGRKLMAFAEDRILRDGPNVFLCVSSFNTEAQKLYARLGYERVGELKNYLVQGHGEILMRKTTGPILTFQRSGTQN